MELAEELLKLRRDLDRITARLDHQVDAIAHVGARLDAIAVQRAPETAARAHAGDARRASAEERTLREESRLGATSLAIASNLDGSAQVRINGGTPFYLQAKPAALLRIIAASGGRTADDGLVGWRSYAEVSVALAKYTGRTATARNVTHTTYKLRKALRDAGQNWFFVQTDQRGNVRFALREAAAGLTADEKVRW